jgi:hypothetical protein
LGPRKRAPWDRRDREPSKAYEAFREYRDLGPLRQLSQVTLGHERTVDTWSARWDWRARAVAWDDAVHRAEDRQRLEAIRGMAAAHAHAGRIAVEKALAALGMLGPDMLTAGEAARLLDLGTRLERSTLLVSVEELQGRVSQPLDGVDDPWGRVAPCRATAPRDVTARRGAGS